MATQNAARSGLSVDELLSRHPWAVRLSLVEIAILAVAVGIAWLFTGTLSSVAAALLLILGGALAFVGIVFVVSNVVARVRRSAD